MFRLTFALLFFLYPISDSFANNSTSFELSSHLQAASSYTSLSVQAYQSNNFEYQLSQAPEDKSFFIELSYNSDMSEVLKKEILSRALREITTIFIGSGYKYVKNEQADLIARVYIDAELSDYKRGSAKRYDFLSKVTIKVYGKDEQLIDQTNKNKFLSGENLEQVVGDSISTSSKLAAKEMVSNLSTETIEVSENQISLPAPMLKVELLFEGNAKYKFYETINKIVKESLIELKVLKRTIKYGNSISLLVLSKLQSQQLAELIIDRIADKSSLEVINVSENRVVFRIN